MHKLYDVFNHFKNYCKCYQIRDVSLFRGGEGYQFFKQGSQKILTHPLNTNKKIVTLPRP